MLEFIRESETQLNKAIANTQLITNIFNACPDITQHMFVNNLSVVFSHRLTYCKVEFFVQQDPKTTELLPYAKLHNLRGFTPEGNFISALQQAWQENYRGYVHALANPTPEEIITKFQKLLQQP